MAKPKLFRKDHLIDSHDDGIKLHLREKKPRGMKKSEAANTMLMVHGQSTPAPVAFDLPLPGYSWMDFAAA
ncbi:MAG: alpha/beta hydrolase, partial [Nitrospinae bacterium]|nr:alpha/beta hydrolase [Nitrospinota bacterium]